MSEKEFNENISAAEKSLEGQKENVSMEAENVPADNKSGKAIRDPGQRVKALQGYLKRLNSGEDFDSVKKSFVEEFENVSFKEIIEAEQGLIKSGSPIDEVQRLCDLHSGLFHGKTRGELLVMERKALLEAQGEVDDSLNTDRWLENKIPKFKDWKSQKRVETNVSIYTLPEGHPIWIMSEENEALEEVLHILNVQVDILSDSVNALDVDNRRTKKAFSALKEGIHKLRRIRILYNKKEEIFMPMLYHHDIVGPMDVMWGVDSEITDSLGKCDFEFKSLTDPSELRITEAPKAENDASDAKGSRGSKGRGSLTVPDARKYISPLLENIKKTLTRIEEMIYKENNIFFPLCVENLNDDEMISAYKDIPEMGYVFIDETLVPKWLYGEEILKRREMFDSANEDKSFLDGIIRFDNGFATVEQLKSIVDLLPVDLTFIDADNNNQLFVNNHKYFLRPSSALGRPVMECHPKKIHSMVKTLLESLKNGTKDSVEMWSPDPERPARIIYAAVRSRTGEYLGTLEIVQDMTDIREHFLQGNK
ncbi:MAG: DUF438 domain-containing protein [Lachnospiraceae bacterium]|nr:DUF438 domain-containing protein [Lachnospiraceae bacterium]MEE3461203.1 DUF438 domain-containing protein [Lachnospiraceae bacterium]